MATRDLSHIKTLTDLQNEIAATKVRISAQELDLKLRVKQAPGEARRYAVIKTVPAALMKIIPFVLTRGAVSSSFGFVKNAAGLFSVFKKQKGNTVKDRIMNTVKKAGAAAAVRSLFSFINKKKQQANEKNQQIEIS